MSVLRLLILSSLVAMAGCSHNGADGATSVLESTPEVVTLPQASAVGGGEQPGIQPATDASGKRARYRLVVSFNSFASGTDPAAAAQFMHILDAEQKALRRPLSRVTHRWGREGETSHCFTLVELNADEQRVFVEAVRSGLKTNRAYFEENATCPDVFNPTARAQ